MENASRRVLCILESAGAGSGRHVIDLLRGLTDRGHAATLLFSRARLEGWFEEELNDIDGLDVATIDMGAGLGPGDVTAVRAMRRFLQANGPFDIVHGHSSKGGALMRLAARPEDGVRLYTPHALYTLGCAPGSLRYSVFARIERYLAKRCEGIICVSDAERRHALVCGLPPDKLFTVPNGLAPLPAAERDVVRSEWGLRPDEVAVGFVGRLVAQKAIGRLIAAFADVRRAAPGTRLVVVGDGPEEGAAKQLARDSGIADAIIWTGRADGPTMMSGFDVFASCSRYEAFPYVFLEAMARGLPMVCTRVGGVDETVRSGSNGLIVEQGDTAALGAALTRVVTDTDARQAMGLQSLEMVRDFSVGRMLDDTLAVYSTLIARRESGAS